MISLILLIAACICCFIAAFWYAPTPPVRPHLGWLGMGFYTLSLILARAFRLQ